MSSAQKEERRKSLMKDFNMTVDEAKIVSGEIHDCLSTLYNLQNYFPKDSYEYHSIYKARCELGAAEHSILIITGIRGN
jgi:hypothetical protein